MSKTLRAVAIAALAVGGMALVGCQSPNNNPNSTAPGYDGGMTGGGSTDSYGTGTDARYRDTGNIGTGFGSGAQNSGATAPQPAGGTAGSENIAAPGQAAPTGSPANGTGTAHGTDQGNIGAPGEQNNTNNTPANTNQGSNGTPNNQTGNTNGAAGTNGPSNGASNGATNAGGANGATVGGTAGNGTSNGAAGGASH